MFPATTQFVLLIFPCIKKKENVLQFEISPGGKFKLMINLSHGLTAMFNNFSLLKDKNMLSYLLWYKGSRIKNLSEIARRQIFNCKLQNQNTKPIMFADFVLAYYAQKSKSHQHKQKKLKYLYCFYLSNNDEPLDVPLCQRLADSVYGG